MPNIRNKIICEMKNFFGPTFTNLITSKCNEQAFTGFSRENLLKIDELFFFPSNIFFFFENIFLLYTYTR